MPRTKKTNKAERARHDKASGEFWKMVCDSDRNFVNGFLKTHEWLIETVLAHLDADAEKKK